MCVRVSKGRGESDRNPKIASKHDGSIKHQKRRLSPAVPMRRCALCPPSPRACGLCQRKKKEREKESTASVSFLSALFSLPPHTHDTHTDTHTHDTHTHTHIHTHTHAHTGPPLRNVDARAERQAAGGRQGGVCSRRQRRTAHRRRCGGRRPLFSRPRQPQGPQRERRGRAEAKGRREGPVCAGEGKARKPTKEKRERK